MLVMKVVVVVAVVVEETVAETVAETVVDVVAVVVTDTDVVVCGFPPVKTEQGFAVSFQPFLPLMITLPQSADSLPPALALLISRYSTGLPLPYQLHAIQPIFFCCAYSMMKPSSTSPSECL